MKAHLLSGALLLILTSNATAQEVDAVDTVDTVFLEELTTVEVQDGIRDGTTTVILPTAGTEQNGPHVVLGKHKYIVNYASEQIARRLGNALVAPVVTYVPEGAVDPPSGHMRYAGTITLPNEFFMNLLRRCPARSDWGEGNVVPPVAWEEERGQTRAHRPAVEPPSIGNAAPVTKRASDEAR